MVFVSVYKRKPLSFSCIVAPAHFHNCIMKLTLFCLACLASKVLGDITFYAHAVHSGSDVHLDPLRDSNGTLQVGGEGDDILFLLPDDSTLANLDATTRIILRNDTFVEVPRGIQHGFKVDKNDYLTFNNHSFVACPNGASYSLATSCPGGIAIEVVATNITRVAVAKRDDNKFEKTYNLAKLFSVKAIAANTDFHQTPINRLEENPHEFLVGYHDGISVDLNLKSDGSLVDSDGRAIDVDSNGLVGGVAPIGRNKASNKFSIQKSKLLHENVNFYACPSKSNKVVLSTQECEGGTKISLEVTHEK